MRSKALFLALRYLFSHGQLLQSLDPTGVFLFLIPSPKLFIAGAGGQTAKPSSAAAPAVNNFGDGIREASSRMCPFPDA